MRGGVCPGPAPVGSGQRQPLPGRPARGLIAVLTELPLSILLLLLLLLLPCGTVGSWNVKSPGRIKHELDKKIVVIWDEASQRASVASYC
jgi:hypothetical protein